MIEERDLLRRASERFTPPVDAYERFIRRRERRRRNQRLAAGIVAVTVVALVAGALAVALGSPQRTAPASPPDAFATARGWIAIGGSTITAVNPEQPADRVVLSTREGDAYVWSNDGAQLAVDRAGTGAYELFVLRGDGTEVRVAHDTASAAFSPDGKSVVYGDLKDLGVYVVDIDSGSRRPIVRGDAASQTGFGYPLISPDGSVIAYAAVTQGSDEGISMMSADGTQQRSIVDLQALSDQLGSAHVKSVYPMAWSPDSRLVAFGATGNDGVATAIFTVRVDGSSLQRVTPLDSGLWWSAGFSPDSTRLAVLSDRRGLLVMGTDGTGSEVLMADPPGRFIAWNPAPP